MGLAKWRHNHGTERLLCLGESNRGNLQIFDQHFILIWARLIARTNEIFSSFPYHGFSNIATFECLTLTDSLSAQCMFSSSIWILNLSSLPIKAWKEWTVLTRCDDNGSNNDEERKKKLINSNFIHMRCKFTYSTCDENDCLPVARLLLVSTQIPESTQEEERNFRYFISIPKTSVRS